MVMLTESGFGSGCGWRERVCTEVMSAKLLVCTGDEW